MLPTKKRSEVLSLGDDDIQGYMPTTTPHRPELKRTQSSFVEASDFKLDRQHEKLKARIVEYFDKYPSFKNGLFTADYITKLCCVVEKYTYKKGIKKLELALEVAEHIAGKSFSDAEKKQLISTISFIHKKGLIKVSFLVKLFYRITDIFR